MEDAWLQLCLPSPAVRSIFALAHFPLPSTLPTPLNHGSASSQGVGGRACQRSPPQTQGSAIDPGALPAAASAKRGNLPPATRSREGPSRPQALLRCYKNHLKGHFVSHARRRRSEAAEAAEATSPEASFGASSRGGWGLCVCVRVCNPLVTTRCLRPALCHAAQSPWHPLPLCSRSGGSLYKYHHAHVSEGKLRLPEVK